MNPWKILAARWNGAAFDDGFNEAAHKRAENGQFGSGASTKTKISAAALKQKLEGMSHEKLSASLKNPNTDPAIKKHIEKELDSRADRGTKFGHREAR